MIVHGKYNIYSNIKELPIENYQAMYETFDFRCLIVGVDLYNLPDERDFDLSHVLKDIEGQIIVKFGLDVRSQEIILLRKKIIEAEFKVIATGEKIFKLPTWKKLLEEKLKKEVATQTEEERHIILSKWSNTNTRKVSVVTYLSTFKMYNDESKRENEKEALRARKRK